MPTRTGSFSIGFRQGWTDWHNNRPTLLAWAKHNGFESIDLRESTTADISAVKAAGLKLGTIDLLDFGNITQPDVAKRKDLIAKNVAYVKELGAAGAKIFFSIVGAEPALKRSENYKIAVESFAPIAEAAASVGATIAVEGYPGNPPHYALLCTTPETCRTFLKDLPNGMSLNYDPSHLIRLSVDHIRFLKEFIGRVVHVHGKDTELFPENQYEFGIYQSSAFQSEHQFGQSVWRYAIPGHGIVRWTEIFKELKKANYKGLVSIELEDENFNTSEVGEKAGLIHSRTFLQGA